MTRGLFGGISEQGKAGIHRLEDARVLYREGRWRGAMYLAGYGVECLLKKKLMEKFHCEHLLQLNEVLHQRGLLPSESTIFVHHLESLLRLADGLERLRQNATAWKQFNIVNRWMPAWRYSTRFTNKDDAEDFVEAVEVTAQWIAANI